MTSKIGIYSGTFDPVHMGHVAFALQAKSELDLDKIIFLPELSPRLKQPAPIQHRCKMLTMSLMGHDGLSVKLLSSERFNIKDTLPELQDLYKGFQLVFLLGSDVVRTFKYRWPGLGDLLASVELVIGLRGEDTKEEMTELLTGCAQHYGTHISFRILPSPHAHLASTQVRRGEHTIDDVHPDAAAYIEAHKLYND